MTNISKIMIGTLIISTWGCTQTIRSSQIKYTIVDLSTLGGSDTDIQAINNSGQVIGKSTTADGSEHAYFWSVGTGMIDLGTLGGRTSSAAAINNSGQVVGYADTENGDRHAFYWDRNTGMIDMGTLGGNTSWALDINNKGQAIGSATIEDDAMTSSSTQSQEQGEIKTEYHGFLWDKENGMVDIGTLGFRESRAYSINDKGQIFGWCHESNQRSHVFLRDANGVMKDLGSPGHQPEGSWRNNKDQGLIGWAKIKDEAWRAAVIDGIGQMIYIEGPRGTKVIEIAGMNSSGQVIGWFQKSGVGQHRRAFLWSSSGSFKNLGTLSYSKGGPPFLDNNSMAMAINDSGVVIGWCGSKFADTFGRGHAWRWDQSNGMLNLKSLLIDSSNWERLILAKCINNEGQIAGIGITKEGKERPFIMTPVDNEESKITQ